MIREKLNRRRWLALLYSLIIAVVLSVLSYFLNNQPLFTGEDLEQYAWMEWVRDRWSSKEKEDALTPLYINVSYDKQLTELCDERNRILGNIDITDREKLLTLLRMLHITGQYKYVFLDIRFEKGYNTESDSALFAEISSMDRIVVATHSDIELADTLLTKKAAVNDYSATVTSNFVRYEFSQDGKPSMPLYAYAELTGKTIKKEYTIIYKCDGELCHNSLFVRFPVESFEEKDEGDKVYYNLGSDILKYYDEDDLAILTKDRYIVIGNLKDDVHDTYAGSRPGSVITFYAFRALMKGEHLVSWWVIVFFLVIYFCISLSLFSHHSWLDCIPLTKKSKLCYFLLSLLGYGMVLFMITVILNLFWGITTSFLIPSSWFAIQNLIINYKRIKI